MWSIANHQPHPTAPFAEVFVYLDKEKGEAFCALLRAEEIPFEIDEEENRLLVGVRRPHIQRAIVINNANILKHKPRFIGNKFARWFILGLFFFAIILGLCGVYFSS